MLSEANIPFEPPWYYILAYYVLLPIVIPLGIIGNVLCISVMAQKLSKQISFYYQAVIGVANTLTLVCAFYVNFGYNWGLGNGVIVKDADRTAFWFERSYVRRWLLQSFFDPLRHYLVSLTPLLIIAASIDRAVALRCPWYYQNRTNRKLVLLSLTFFSFALAIPIGLQAGMGREIKEVLINTTQEGPVVVYKRSFKPGWFNSTTAAVLGLTANGVRLGTLIVLFASSITVQAFFHCTMRVLAAKDRKDDEESEAVSGCWGLCYEEKLLVKVMLAQCILVAIASCPFSVLTLNEYFFPWKNLYVLPVHVSRDVGYTLQASLVMVCYALVSERFQQELKALFYCSKFFECGRFVLAALVYDHTSKQAPLAMEKQKIPLCVIQPPNYLPIQECKKHPSHEKYDDNCERVKDLEPLLVACHDSIQQGNKQVPLKDCQEVSVGREGRIEGNCTNEKNEVVLLV